MRSYYYYSTLQRLSYLPKPQLGAKPGLRNSKSQSPDYHTALPLRTD